VAHGIERDFQGIQEGCVYVYTCVCVCVCVCVYVLCVEGFSDTLLFFTLSFLLSIFNSLFSSLLLSLCPFLCVSVSQYRLCFVVRVSEILFSLLV